MKKKIIIIAICILALSLLLITFYFKYDEYVYNDIAYGLITVNHTDITVTYDNQTYTLDNRKNSLATFMCQYKVYNKRKLYYGDVDENAMSILMNVPDYGRLKIYYRDKNTVFFIVERDGHLTRKYILTYFTTCESTDFDLFLDSLYKATKDDMFLTE